MSLLMNKPNAIDLDIFKALYEADMITPVIDQCYPLSNIAKAFRYDGEGRAKGKVVISVTEDV